MNTNKSYQFEESLNKIQRVNAPEFLFTRIQHKIKEPNQDKVPVVWSLAISFSFAVLLLVNVLTFTSYNKSIDTEVGLVEQLNLYNNNNLYN